MKAQDMDRDWTTTARTLSEALPYMQRYAGAVVVVKFGGNAMGDADDNSEQLAREIFEGIDKQAFLITNQQGRSRLRSRRWRPKRFFEEMKTLAARIRR